MLNFYSRTSPTIDFAQSDLPTKEDSKIPFYFGAIPYKLFEKGLKLATVGVYAGIARYVNWKMQMTIGERKVITGWTIPVSQETLADQLNTTRQTVIQHLKILVQAGVIETKQTFRGCYRYRLVAYKEGIEQLKREQQEREEQEREEQTNRQATNPAAPTPEQVDRYIQSEQQTQSAKTQSTSGFQVDDKISDSVCQELRHIKEMLRYLKNKTLSSGGNKHTETETETPEDNENWTDDNSNNPQTDTASDEPFDDEQQSSSDNVPPPRSAHPKSAREVVASQIHTRHCLASIGFKQAYTDEEIEVLWVAAYERFGAPSTVEQWVADRLYVRENLVQYEVEDPYSDEEIEVLRRRAREL